MISETRPSTPRSRCAPDLIGMKHLRNTPSVMLSEGLHSEQRALLTFDVLRSYCDKSEDLTLFFEPTLTTHRLK